MHERNIYSKKKPDFAELAKFHPEFGRLVKYHEDGNCTVDFQNSEAVRLLAIALLAKDFNLHVDLTVERLVPAVPQRLNYLHWVEDLLAGGDRIPTGATTHGTGASVIFPLLGARLNGWSWIATEIDELSLQLARTNVAKNNLGNLITVVEVNRDDYLLAPLSKEATQQRSHDFCMCNPPFFGSESEASGWQRTVRRPSPHAATTGCVVEKVASGGEVDFVKAIIADSVQLRERVRWYTTMLGKKASLRPLLAQLKHYDCKVTTTQFVQGKTVRWGLAWTFDSSQATPQIMTENRVHKRKRPFHFSVSSEADSGQKGLCKATAEAVVDYLRVLQVSISESTWSPMACSFHCKAFKDTWTHHRRRSRQLQCELARGKAHLPSMCSSNTTDTAMQPGSPQGEEEKCSGSHAIAKSASQTTEMTSFDEKCTSERIVAGEKIQRSSPKCAKRAFFDSTLASVPFNDVTTDIPTDGVKAAAPSESVAVAASVEIAELAAPLCTSDSVPLLSFTVTVSLSEDNEESVVSFECEDHTKREVLHCIFTHLQNRFQKRTRAHTQDS